MEIKLTRERMFWIAYALFCIGSTGLAELLGVIDLAQMKRAEQVIFIASLILSGVAMRHWFKCNLKRQGRSEP